VQRDLDEGRVTEEGLDPYGCRMLPDGRVDGVSGWSLRRTACRFEDLTWTGSRMRDAHPGGQLSRSQVRIQLSSAGPCNRCDSGRRAELDLHAPVPGESSEMLIARNEDSSDTLMDSRRTATSLEAVARRRISRLDWLLGTNRRCAEIWSPVHAERGVRVWSAKRIARRAREVLG
jgi:hypothetical protein